ncbi:hypothetical protein [Arthrobacter globiformis]|uniref:hypothetical protein n=1 Tax=Arthrobacter globiformis TaxID=1665 RepID=UPI0027887A54|nr:hypothetical protein [Arthrobacter globiformis]MDQ0865812.1 hypothetical protein [Arthrobacter globiformis]
MPEYKIWLDAPTLSIHAAIQNLGHAIREKDGVFAIRLLDEHLTPLSQDECKLPVSKHLDENFVYVPETPAGSLISMGIISATKPFQGAEIRYEGLFTDQPLTASQLGPIFFSALVAEQKGRVNRTVTRLVRAYSDEKDSRA